MNLLTLLQKGGCMGCLLFQKILVANRKNGCLSCFICRLQIVCMNVLAKNQKVVVCVMSLLHVYFIIFYE